MKRLLLIALMMAIALSHKCIHDEIVENTQMDYIPIDSERVMNSAGEFRPLEIKIVWGDMNGATEAQKAYAKTTMIPYSLNYISKVLNVNSMPKLDLTHLKTRIEKLKARGISYTPKCGKYVIPMELIENPIE